MNARGSRRCPFCRGSFELEGGQLPPHTRSRLDPRPCIGSSQPLDQAKGAARVAVIVGDRKPVKAS